MTASTEDLFGPTVSVLLIEDDTADALLVEEMAADALVELKITWVTSLEAAHESLESQRPDCVLLDLHLPDAQGFDALTSVQQFSSDVPVIVMTGLAAEDAGVAAVAAGAQDYLVKGRVNAESLARATRYAIERKRAQHAAAELRVSEQRSQENARLERGLLPVPLVHSDHLEIVARYRAGRTHGLLGGDFYDVVECEDRSVHVLIGDVCGHGADEAALGVALRIAWRTLVLAGVDAETSMGTLEELLSAERPRSHIFATVTSLVLHPDRRHTVEIVRAGHPGIMLRTPTGVEWLEVAGGPALGLRRKRGTWTTAVVEVGPGTGVVLFTDGLFEVPTGPQAQLCEDGLLAYAQSCDTDAGGEQFVDALINHTEQLAEPYGGLDDDLAVLLVQWAQEDE